MNERSIEIVREYHFDPKEVIKGLNGYYESDKCNGYITIKRNDVEGPAYLTAALYLSALIEWLREDHDIFYRPGLIFDQVEAARSAAKMCGLRAHIKDEICKRGLWCGADEDIPELVDTLFRAYDECAKLRDENRKEVVTLSKENQELKEGVCKDIMNYIRYESSRNDFDLPEEIDGEPLTIKRVFHDLLELLRKRGVEIRNLNVEIKAKESGIEDLKEHITLLEADLKKRTAEIKEVNDQRWKDLRDIHSALGCYDVYTEVDDFLKAVKARAEHIERLSRNAERETRKAVNDQLKKDTDYVADVLSTILEALGISKSDTVHLDVPGLKIKAINRAVVIKSEHDKYLEQLDSKNRYISDRIRSSCKAHGIDIDAGLLATSDWQQLVTFLCSEVEKLKDEIEEECKGQAMVTRQETKQECYKYLWDALKALNPDCDALKITDYEKLVGRIFYEMSLVNDRCKRCRREHTNEKFGYIQRTNKAEEEVKKLKEQKDRAAAILQDLYRDIFDEDCTQFTYEDIATKILDKVLETEDLLHKSVDSVNKECKAVGKQMVEDYKLKVKDYILKDIKDHGYRYNGLETKSIEDIIDWIITMATCPRNEWVDSEIKKLRGQINSLKDLINAMNEEVKDM